METHGQIPIWFFIGLLLLVYGILITGAGIYHLFWPPAKQVALYHLHADIWWGALMGAFYTWRYWPRRQTLQ